MIRRLRHRPQLGFRLADVLLVRMIEAYELGRQEGFVHSMVRRHW